MGREKIRIREKNEREEEEKKLMNRKKNKIGS